MNKHTGIVKILHKDELASDFDEILESNPDNIVLAYLSEDGHIHTIWYGSVTSAIGLVEILKTDIVSGIDK